MQNGPSPVLKLLLSIPAFKQECRCCVRITQTRVLNGTTGTVQRHRGNKVFRCFTKFFQAIQVREETEGCCLLYEISLVLEAESTSDAWANFCLLDYTEHRPRRQLNPVAYVHHVKVTASEKLWLLKGFLRNSRSGTRVHFFKVSLLGSRFVSI
jgi:hypothetical protein